MLSRSRIFAQQGSGKQRLGGGNYPLALSRSQFDRMRRSPGARKPWRSRPDTVDAQIETSFITDVASGRQVRESEWSAADPLMSSGGAAAAPSLSPSMAAEQRRKLIAFNSGRIPPGSPLSPVGFRDMQPQQTRALQQDRRLSDGEYDEAEEYPSSPMTTMGQRGGHRGGGDVDDDDAGLTRYGGGHGELQQQQQQPHHDYAHVGKDLAVGVEHSGEIKHTSDVPLTGLSHSFDINTRKTQVVLPRHLNDLFAKISKWSGDLAATPAGAADIELDNRTGTIDNPSPEAVKANPLLAKHAMTRAKEKLQYGALMDCYENDRHAIENKLVVAGAKFERKFMNWQGAKLLENMPQQHMHDTKESKGSLLLHSPNAFKIPRLNHDPCSGCGATVQCDNENEFGYCYPGDVEQYILTWQATLRARAEYAQRMHELMSHWEKHGKRVGEEWLDFMTQEEFNAVFRFVSRQFLCRRCVTLRKFGVTSGSMQLSAPDFRDKLMALRDKKCVVVLVVDLTDFPGSMVPDLPGLISMNNPVIIAANKLDCVNPVNFSYRGRDAIKARMRVGPGYLRQWVREQALQFRLPTQQIASVVPVSARKGWGIHELVEQIERAANLTLIRPTPPLPTYFVGVSNVGKSSVINAIAHHLYVPQPPHPSSKKQYFTYIDERTGAERISHKWITDRRLDAAEMHTVPDGKSRRHSALMTTSPLPGTTINAVAVKIALSGGERAETNERYAGGSSGSGGGAAGKSAKQKSHSFLFDTPGLHPAWQETSPFNLRGQIGCLIRSRGNPRAVMLREGFTLFFSAGARIDVVKAPNDVNIMFFMYHNSKGLSTSFCPTEQADAHWQEHAGKTLFPPGAPEQLDDAGGLCVKRSYLFECYSQHRRRPKADIYFCGLGWVSFYTDGAADVVLRVRTLPGIVHGVRRPLRKNDMSAYRGWPSLPVANKAQHAAAIAERVVSKVFELEDKPVDLSKPAMEPIIKTAPLSAVSRAPPTSASPASAAIAASVVGSGNAPFEFIMQELQKQGKLKAS